MESGGIGAVVLEEPVKTQPTPEHNHGQGAEAVKDIVCGSVAGIVGKYIEYPFDTVKVRLQSQPDHLPLLYKGPLDCFKKSLRADGFLGIYRGISAPLVGAAVETSCLFFSYRLAQDAVKATLYPELKSNADRELPYTALLGCGAVSGAFTSVFLTPIELVKCKMQVPQQSSTRISISGTIASIYRHQGLMGYWHGQLGTLIRETGGSAAWFGGYEGIKLMFKKLDSGTTPAKENELPIYQRLAAGAVAGMSYNFLFFPADTIKSRMQTEDVARLTGGKSTFGAVGRAIWKQHGLGGLYRGCGITVGRSIPSSAFIFTVYEELKKPGDVSRARRSFVGEHRDRHGEVTGTRGMSVYAAFNFNQPPSTELMALQQALEKIVLDPQYHDILTLVKGIRNGIVYGSKVRFPHALVMIFLFRSGSFRSKCWLVFKATRQHARNLGLFALVYKSAMLLLRHTSPTGKERHYDSFVAGLLGGYTVFARTIHNSVSQQIVIYVFARVVLALAKLAVQQKHVEEVRGSGGGWGIVRDEGVRKMMARNGWPVFASLSWAMVMYVFRWHPETVQSSLRSSMHYIYVESDHWDSLRTLIWHNK
ncbi:mitochondrial carrier [Polyplosphaeria fusca]|uniref:Mitochondrial carrier n=1 Tax=Polyplosphaeria fusca TaxID=682080 RepID=A0A9P4R6X1_9PLEO|nr:mitochondrial carrier [Polyplosphaeria fusca]